MDTLYFILACVLLLVVYIGMAFFFWMLWMSEEEYISDEEYLSEESSKIPLDFEEGWFEMY